MLKVRIMTINKLQNFYFESIAIIKYLSFLKLTFQIISF